MGVSVSVSVSVKTRDSASLGLGLVSGASVSVVCPVSGLGFKLFSFTKLFFYPKNIIVKIFNKSMKTSQRWSGRRTRPNGGSGTGGGTHGWASYTDATGVFRRLVQTASVCGAQPPGCTPTCGTASPLNDCRRCSF